MIFISTIHWGCGKKVLEVKFPQLKKWRPLFPIFFRKIAQLLFLTNTVPALFFTISDCSYRLKTWMEGSKNKKRLVSRTLKVKELFLQTAFPNNQRIEVREFFTDNMYGTVSYRIGAWDCTKLEMLIFGHYYLSKYRYPSNGYIETFF